MPLRPWIVESALLVAFLLGTGCDTTGSSGTGDPARWADARPGTADEWADLVERQAARLDALSRFSSAGSLVLRHDPKADGRFETERADHRLWRVAPDKAAVRLSIAGSTGARVGWNDDTWWILDERASPPRLRIIELPEQGASIDGGDGFLPPPVLLAVVGLLEFPAAAPDDFEIAGGRMRFSLPGSRDVGQVVRVELERPREGPSGVRILGEDGTVLLESSMSRFKPVETLGAPPGAWPDLAHRIEVVRTGGEGLVITFDRPLAQGRISDRLFDLEAIVERSSPIIVDGDEPAGLPRLEPGDGE